MSEKVYIILLNYNGWKDTIECLESILKNDYENYQIIVVDNDSPNNSMEYIINWAEGKQDVIYDVNSQLKHLSQPSQPKPLNYVFYTKEEALNDGDKENESKLHNPIMFIQSGENGGFAAGNNIGIKYALAKDDFKFIWLLNNDTVIEKDSLSSLVDCAAKNNFGISGSSLFYYDNPEKIQAYGGYINKFFGTGRNIVKKNDIDIKLDYVVGASFLINIEVLSKIGLLPEDYFLYYEETDYCFNARDNGFKLGIDTHSIVFHKEGSTTGLQTKSDFIDTLILKNRITFHKKYLKQRIGMYLGIIILLFNRIRRGQFQRFLKLLKSLIKS